MSLLEKIDPPRARRSTGQKADPAGGGQGARSASIFPRSSTVFLAYPVPRLAAARRAPLKWSPVPKDPVAGDKAAGEAILHGRFLCGGEAVAVDTLDFAALPGSARTMFRTICRVSNGSATSPPRRPVWACRRAAEKIVHKWLAATPRR